MRKDERIFLVVTAVIMVAICSFLAMRLLYYNDANISGQIIPEQNEVPIVEEEPEVSVTKEYVTVFFIGQNENREEVYKAVKREYDSDVDGSKIKFALQALFSGPKQFEKTRGVYTEIPNGTNIISISETADKVVVNVNATFETGGGTESIYKRLNQIIKTAKQNTNKPVYLYIEGFKAEVIGGEGLMITQPLNEKSLEG